MRPPNQSARNQLMATLRRRPWSSAAELAAALEVSVSTVHRLVREVPSGELLASGNSRRTRYAARRALRGDAANLPLYEIDAAGGATLLSQLALVAPQGSLLPLQDTRWPTPEAARDGHWDGLPYPLHDMRPQGYMGRQLAQAEHRQLGVAQDPREWSDEDVIFVLARVGFDVTGNLLLGNDSYDRWLRAKVTPSDPVAEDQRGARYAALAQQAVAAGPVGSSAAGEFPKFTTARTRTAQATPHVIVKFSGAGDNAAERRWADLLVCEHLALTHLAQMPGLASARTDVVHYAGRTFLEVERFDRVGQHGRLPLCSLDALNLEFLGESTTEWPRLATRLHAMRLVDSETVRAIERLWWFGRLVANTDMHLGNLSFHPRTQLQLAPAYDMLPMAYAPLAGGEVPPRAFDPPLPRPAQRDAWQAGCRSAIAFWQDAGTDTRISAAFRATCMDNGRRLREIAALV